MEKFQFFRSTNYLHLRQRYFQKSMNWKYEVNKRKSRKILVIYPFGNLRKDAKNYSLFMKSNLYIMYILKIHNKKLQTVQPRNMLHFVYLKIWKYTQFARDLLKVIYLSPTQIKLLGSMKQFPITLKFSPCKLLSAIVLALRLNLLCKSKLHLGRDTELKSERWR